MLCMMCAYPSQPTPPHHNAYQRNQRHCMTHDTTHIDTSGMSHCTTNGLNQAASLVVRDNFDPFVTHPLQERTVELASMAAGGQVDGLAHLILAGLSQVNTHSLVVCSPDACSRWKSGRAGGQACRQPASHAQAIKVWTYARAV